MTESFEERSKRLKSEYYATFNRPVPVPVGGPDERLLRRIKRALKSGKPIPEGMGCTGGILDQQPIPPDVDI